MTNSPRASGPGIPAGAALLAALLILGGCSSVQPKPTTQEEVAERVKSDQTKMFADQEPVTGPIGFHEAAARAIKYNLDYRAKLMEEALARGILDVSRYDMLPKLLANAGYAWRNNDLAQRSDQVVPTRVPFAPYSTSLDSSRVYGDLTFSWNILDFGVSYYRARQQSDQVLIAEERRRKAMQNVLQDVRTAYWRALGAQRLLSRMDSVMNRADQAMVKARQIEAQGLMPQPQILAYQRALIDATTLLQIRRQDLELSQAELSSLMTLPPGTRFTLADEQEVPLPPVPSNASQLEDMALQRRPELREEDYRKRITSLEVRKSILSTLPGISFDLGANYDGNSYLLHDTWVQGGVRMSMNLFRLAAIPSIKKANEAQQQADETRRMALSMAVVTQTRVAAQRYGLALADLKQAEEGARVDERLLDYARAAQTTRVDAELEVIRNEARSLLSQYQRYIAYANAQAAWGRVYNSVGLDVLPADVADADVKSLAATLAKTLDGWEREAFTGQRSSAVPAPLRTAGADAAGK